MNYSRTEPELWVEELGEWIGYLHISDNNGAFDEHLPLGEGTVDWEKADALFKKVDREMPVTLEAGSPEGVCRSLAYLKKRRYFGL